MKAPAWPLTALPGVGTRTAERLQRLGLRTVADLLFHLPIRYEDRTRLRPLAALRAGERVLVEGVVVWSEQTRGPRPRLVCRLSDGSGELDLVFFHCKPQQRERFRQGSRWRCFGEVRAGFTGLQMAHPECQPVQLADADRSGVPTTLTPVYRTTEGLQQRQLRRLVDLALALQPQVLPELLPEWLPAGGWRQAGWPPLGEALQQLHRPPPESDTEAVLAGTHPALQRIAYEELLAHHLAWRQERGQQRVAAGAPVLTSGEALAARLRAVLPFTLTAAQQRVEAEVAADLASPQPMLRLLQGDVGSGKTVVAALACARAIGSGYQAVLMAPTELLAEQHGRVLRGWLEPLGVELAWVSGSLPAAQRREALRRLASGEAQLGIGTHALFQEAVELSRLGLVVVDEQHRFGVHQRLALKEKGQDGAPHQLIMTATPIPRTLAMTAYADLDLSLLDERPPGRQPVRTAAVEQGRRHEVIERMRAALAQGRQAYWVCTLIEASEELSAQAAAETADQLAAALPEHTVGLVHGRMAPAEKERVMAAFAAGEIALLVATTVIEVGVDVPNATLMVIENAERLGLAQLHQLRGRIGRGAAASACLLMYHGPLSVSAQQRLSVLRQTEDGFAIAEHDLAIRGPGELLGTRQTGVFGLRIADLQRDGELIERARTDVEGLLKAEPQCIAALVERWVGERQRYGQV
ncbi:ATP-dependent DNA helicase RecG [Halorhodospira abdelmalekii]|uniref:ATP-dependent DNA helicase RecG n=1 Tax=Halorhodospira abdelmalekii TaxID=421629 RepID=UPI001908DE8D|nr:ATP-dependent DNA helicase RecG [Halorhodospira abdelmalekii]